MGQNPSVVVEVAAMRDIPESVRRHLRVLSLGPDQEWGFWGWTFHRGRTWAAVAFGEAGVLGWAGLTRDVDVLPVVGVYVRGSERGSALARGLVERLLECLLAEGELDDAAAVFASTERWADYPEIIEGFGLRCLTWQ